MTGTKAKAKAKAGAGVGVDMVSDVLEAWQVQTGKLRAQASGEPEGLAQGAAKLAAVNGSGRFGGSALALATAAGLPATNPEAAADELLTKALTEFLPRLLREGQEAAEAVAGLRTEGLTPNGLRAAWREVREVAEVLALGASEFTRAQEYLGGADALALAQVLTRFVLRSCLRPVLPGGMYWALEGGVVAGVEWLYRSRVRGDVPQL